MLSKKDLKHLVEKMQDNSIGKILMDGLAVDWGPLPDGGSCTSCGSKNMKRCRPRLSGPYSGHVRCFDCNHQETVMMYLGKTCFKVEPLPQGAVPIYEKDE
jgi:hypothetical protein